MILKHSSEVKGEPVANSVSSEIQWLIDHWDGAPTFELRKFRIGPGGRISKHYHPDIEHVQYVLKGSYSIGVEGRIHTVKPDDALIIFAGEAHWYENKSEDDAEFLCIIPKVEKYKTEKLPE